MQRFLPIERRNLNLRPERGLREADRDRAEQIASIPIE